MNVLLIYDIAKEDGGSGRLRKIAKTCENFGIRVQSSTFELDLTEANLKKLKNELKKLINNDDSIRIYHLGKNFKDKLEIIGKREVFELMSDDSFIL